MLRTKMQYRAWAVAGAVALAIAGSVPYVAAVVATDAGAGQIAIPVPFVAAPEERAYATTVSALPVARPAKPPKRVHAQRTALLIGVDRAPGIARLEGSVTDARHMRDALLGYGFRRSDMKVLLNGEATLKAIRRELDALSTRTDPDGIAVFAVASHSDRRDGVTSFATGDGRRMTAQELAKRLGRVRSRMWSLFATCYASGYAKRGVVGKGRIATFASSASEPTYQLGSAGSYLVMHMVRDGMLGGRAPDSVESAFRYARDAIESRHLDRLPLMRDGIPGDVVLGRVRVRATPDAESTDEPHHADPSPDATAPPKEARFCLGLDC